MYQSSSSSAPRDSGDDGPGLDEPALEAKIPRRGIRDEEVDVAIHGLQKERGGCKMIDDQWEIGASEDVYAVSFRNPLAIRKHGTYSAS